MQHRVICEKLYCEQHQEAVRLGRIQNIDEGWEMINHALEENFKLPVWAANIQLLTKQRGISQAEMARKAGMNKVAFNRYHNGTTRPTADRLAMLANAFGVAPSDIDPDRYEGAVRELFQGSAAPYRISPAVGAEDLNVRLDVGCDVSVDVAMKIVTLLMEDKKKQDDV